jgi:hypothetical protein
MTCLLFEGSGECLVDSRALTSKTSLFTTSLRDNKCASLTLSSIRTTNIFSREYPYFDLSTEHYMR